MTDAELTNNNYLLSIYFLKFLTTKTMMEMAYNVIAVNLSLIISQPLLMKLMKVMLTIAIRVFFSRRTGHRGTKTFTNIFYFCSS